MPESRLTDASSAAVAEASRLLQLAIAIVGESSKQVAQSKELLETIHDSLDAQDGALDGSRTLREQLRVAVTTLAFEQRTAGVPPEQMLKLLKQLVAKAKIDALESDAARTFTNEVVRWGIEAYYAA